MLDLACRRKICEETISRSASLASSLPNGTLSSTFIPSQLPPLLKSSTTYPNLSSHPIQVVNSDAFALARRFQTNPPPPSSSSTPPNIGVLNLASDQQPGGGWRYTLSRTQEEALCYSSTLYATLRPEWYPWPNTGPGSCAGIVSPGVVVYRDTLDRDLVELKEEERFSVVVLTVAAPRFPRVSEDGSEFADEAERGDLKEKIVLVLRMAAQQGVMRLVLGAMGCGAYGCPPQAVTREMKEVLGREEFEGWFDVVGFAIYAAGATGRRNLEVFNKVFEDGVKGVVG